MKRLEIPEDELRHLYLEKGLTIKVIAEQMGVSVTPIWRSMKRYNIRPKSMVEYNRSARRRLEISKANLVNLYVKEKLSIHEMRNKLSISPKTIRKLFADYQIEIRTQSEAGQLSASRGIRDENGHGRNWRGGKRENLGYIQIWKPHHHRANGAGYVYEHIMVWEDNHKSELPKGWIVHHLNGIRDDNRPENLTAMKRGRHLHQAEPYKVRISQLERRVRDLEQALETNQTLFTISA